MNDKFLPLYRQIAEKIKQEIYNKNLQQGDAIPSEAKLTDKFNVSRVTIRQAIDVLVNEDLLYKVQGSGTYVKKTRLEHNIYTLETFTEEAIRHNKVPVNKIIDFKITKPSDEIKVRLNLLDEDKVYFISRLRCIDNTPLVLEKTYLPIKLFPDLSYETMLSSKYDYIENKKSLTIKQSHQEIIPILPNEELINLMSLKKDQPILHLVMDSILDDGTVFEYTELYFKSDEYKFSLVAKR
ncbi:GntR family transcriptional regulator [Halonatronum saccharophilum]|uniref:GntR family transcriptional regulator n=1 Tax=Halonatronum saccharophilum TaxID=150060 RepID=UPI0004894396|nr:UTRA domain-containing protein [Halonatronum saccharophilum]